MENLFSKFINRIGFYTTTIFQVDTHLKEFVKFRKGNLPKNLSKDFVMPVLGSKLIYRNILTAKHEFAFSRLIDIENIDEKIHEIKDSYCNFCISQSFEAFETFLKDILAFYFVADKNFVKSNFKNNSIDNSNFITCRADINKLLKKDNKYNKQLFKWLYKIDNDISKYEQKNFLRFNFYEWNIVFTEIRHSIVHSNSILSKSKTKDWTKFQNDLLEGLFTGKKTESEIIISTYNDYEYIIRIIAQHGQLIYDKIKTAYNTGLAQYGPDN
mgnify:CR=1 FL=1